MEIGMYRLTFDYATQGKPYELGRGRLQVWLDETVVCESAARTGSVDASGELVKWIHPGEWWILQPSQDTKENAMVIGNIGWKIRLWEKEGPRYRFTHYLIHPDGGLPGSLGCIVTPTLCLELRETIDTILKDHQNKIPLIINGRTG
jgi:hypothetical protein